MRKKLRRKREIPSPPLGERVRVRGQKPRRYKIGLIKRARRLRQRSTYGEQKLWAALRRLPGLKFRRQKPIGPYIADFYCFSLKCIIEVDGDSHAYKLKSDKIRDAFMQQRGLHVLRFMESEVMTNCDGVVETILAFAHAAVTPSPKSSPPKGERTSSLAS